jgi:VWFA-related protein
MHIAATPFVALLLLIGVPCPAEDTAGSQPDARVSITPRGRTTTPGSINGRAANIRVDSNLVLINVTVTTPLNQVVTGLDKDHFRLFEDKIEQSVSQFSSEDAPLSVGLVFDLSGSMGSKLHKARQAAAQFFKTANPEDEFFLIQFSDRPRMTMSFTTETEEIQNRLAFSESRGRTALLDALYMAMDQMKKARNPRKAILVLSDGGDNSSRYTQSEIKSLVREADVQVYAIGIFEPVHSRSRTAEELAGPGLLGELADQTGGRHFPVENVNELPDIAAKIGIELRNQYVLGYVPSNEARDGKYRRVRVKLVQPRGLPPLRAAYRTGYYAPSQ